MQNTKTMEQEELLQLQTSAERMTESSKNSSKLITREPFRNSVLTIIGQELENNTEQWFIAIGNKRLTEYYPTKEQAEESTYEWDFKITLMTAIADDAWNYRQAEHSKKLLQIMENEKQKEFDK